MTEQVLREQIATPAPHTLARDDIERRKGVVAAEVHAKEIHRNSMPPVPTAVPDLDLAVSNISCDETGGSQSAAEILAAIVEALKIFRGSARQSDDITLMVIKRV